MQQKMQFDTATVRERALAMAAGINSAENEGMVEAAQKIAKWICKSKDDIGRAQRIYVLNLVIKRHGSGGRSTAALLQIAEEALAFVDGV